MQNQEWREQNPRKEDPFCHVGLEGTFKTTPQRFALTLVVGDDAHRQHPKPEQDRDDDRHQPDRAVREERHAPGEQAISEQHSQHVDPDHDSQPSKRDQLELTQHGALSDPIRGAEAGGFVSPSFQVKPVWPYLTRRRVFPAFMRPSPASGALGWVGMETLNLPEACSDVAWDVATSDCHRELA